MSALLPNAKAGVNVDCATCGYKFPQDPPFNVPCRQCGAGVNHYCKRPSEHSGPLVEFHAIRDVDALMAGHYDHSGTERCGPSSTSTRAKEIFEKHNQNYPPTKKKLTF